MMDNLSFIWISHLFSLTFLTRNLVISKKKVLNIFNIFEVLFKTVILFEKLRIFWLFYYLMYFRVIKFYDIFFFGSYYLVDNNFINFSIFSKLKLAVSYNINFFFKTKILMDLNFKLPFLNFKLQPIHGFYLVNSFRSAMPFSEYEGLSANLRMVTYFMFSHEYKQWGIGEIFNYNSNQDNLVGFDNEKERGFYLLQKELVFKGGRKSIRVESENFYVGIPFNFFTGISDINLETSHLNSYEVILPYINDSFLYNNLIDDVDFTFLNKDFTFYNGLNCTDHFLHGHMDYNLYDLSYSAHFLIDRNMREILTYLTLLIDRLNVERSWTFIFDSENILSNYHHIYSYLNEYWVLRCLLYSDIKKWFTFLNNFNFNMFTSTETTDDIKLSWNLNNLIPLLSSAPLRSFSAYNQRLVFKRLIVFKTEMFYWLFNNYVITLLQNALQKKIFFSIHKNPIHFLDKDASEKALYILRDTNLVFKRIYFTQEFADVLIALGASKDPLPFANWLAKNIRETEFWKHWAFISYVRFSVRDMFGILNTVYNLRGISIRFKGKIGNKGSFRKKRSLIHYGNIRKSNVFVRADKAYSISSNFTGLIGIIVTVAY